jgi:hypothetical protein
MSKRSSDENRVAGVDRARGEVVGELDAGREPLARLDELLDRGLLRLLGVREPRVEEGGHRRAQRDPVGRGRQHHVRRLELERLRGHRGHQVEERLVEDDAGVVDVPLVVELDARDQFVGQRLAADGLDDLARAVGAGQDVPVHVAVQIARGQSRHR